MEKTRATSQEPPISAAYPASEKSEQRAQKRLATQSERDEMADLSPPPEADLALGPECAMEGQ